MLIKSVCITNNVTKCNVFKVYHVTLFDKNVSVMKNVMENVTECHVFELDNESKFQSC